MGEGRPKLFFGTSTNLSLWFQAAGSLKILSQLCHLPIQHGSGRPVALSQHPKLSQGPPPNPKFTTWPVQSDQCC